MNHHQLGKINKDLLHNFILNKCGHTRSEIIVPPAFGVDVAIIALPNGLAMALTSDPLSLIPTLGLRESAWLSVQIIANDMATTGLAPMYGQFVLNLPAHFSQSDFNIYWDYIHKYCKKIGIAVTGGHTGFIEGQNSTIAGGATFITIAPRHQILCSKNAEEGDTVLVTKSCAMTATAILAMSFQQTVKNKLGHESYRKACESFYATSSLQEALLVADLNKSEKTITAMHDVTEGGVLGAIYELSKAGRKGALIEADLLPVGDIQKQVCRLFSLDPHYCVGAGSMIITCKSEKTEQVIHLLKANDIPCTAVGSIQPENFGICLREKGRIRPLPYLSEDPYWMAYSNAVKANWK